MVILGRGMVPWADAMASGGDKRCRNPVLHGVVLRCFLHLLICEPDKYVFSESDVSSRTLLQMTPNQVHVKDNSKGSLFTKFNPIPSSEKPSTKGKHLVLMCCLIGKNAYFVS